MSARERGHPRRRRQARVRPAVLIALLTAVLANVALTPAHATERRARPTPSTRPCEAVLGAFTLGAPPVVVSPRPGVVCFGGDIDAASSKSLTALISTVPPGRRLTLWVMSGGGDASEGLDISETLARVDATVVVDRLCASSCANYLFIAARRRIIAPGGLLVFHGGVSKALLAQLPAALAPLKARDPSIDVDAVIKRETARLSVDLDRQDRLLERRHVDRAFFTFFDRLAAGGLRSSTDCAANPDAAGLVFSRKILEAEGIRLQSDGGPRTARQLRAALAATGRMGRFCFWDIALGR